MLFLNSVNIKKHTKDLIGEYGTSIYKLVSLTNWLRKGSTIQHLRVQQNILKEITTKNGFKYYLVTLNKLIIKIKNNMNNFFFF